MSADHASGQRVKPILFPRSPFLLLLLLIPVALFPLSCLEVSDVHDDRVLLMSPMSTGETFEIHYIHSVQKIPVAGVFRVTDGNKVEVTESIFSSYGAGLPFDTPREDVILEGDHMRIRHRGMVMDRLRIFVSPFTHQQLIYSGKALDLFRVKGGHVVEVRVRRVPLFLYWASKLWRS